MIPDLGAQTGIFGAARLVGSALHHARGARDTHITAALEPPLLCYLRAVISL